MNILHNASIEIKPIFVNCNAYYAEVISSSGLLLHETDTFPTRLDALKSAEVWIEDILLMQTDEEGEYITL